MCNRTDETKNKLQKLLGQVGEIKEVNDLIKDISCKDDEIFEDAEEIIIVADEDAMNQVEKLILCNNIPPLVKIEKKINRFATKSVSDTPERNRTNFKIDKNIPKKVPKSARCKGELETITPLELSLKLFFKSFSITMTMPNFPLHMVEETRKAILDLISIMKVKALKESGKEIYETESMDLKSLESSDITIDLFFEEIASMVSKFPANLITEAKIMICSLVSEIELLAIRESEKSKYSATFTYMSSE